MNDIASSDRSVGTVENRVEGQIGWIVFNNESRLNAISPDMAGAAARAAQDFDENPDIRVVIMRGAGEKAFISGGDISLFHKITPDASTAKVTRNALDGFRDIIADLSKPVIAMVHGYCLGGGLAVAMAADLRFVSSDSRLGIPAAQRGVGYSMIGLKRLLDLVGVSRAKDIMFSARKLDAGEALSIGLVDRVHAPEELEAATLKYAQELCRNAPLSIKASKFMLNQLLLPVAERDSAKIESLLDAAADSADFKEATQAFLEKRKPVFRGE